MRTKLSLEQLNALAPTEFHKIFENVVESWPEAAIFCSAMLPFKNFDTMITVFENYLQKLGNDNKIRILRLYPDLAGKLLDSHELTEESSFEHKSAGLDVLSSEDKEKLTALNEEYRQRFGFPFVICVREAAKFEAILNGFTNRINNRPEVELEIAIGEVKKICRLRILELVNKL